jgi:hypothetical protein
MSGNPVKSAAVCSYGAAAILFTLYVVLPRSLISGASRVFEVAAYLLLLPVVAALPATSWARAAGYAWATVSVISSVAPLHSSEAGAELLRLGGFVMGASWIASASLASRGALAAVGLPLTLLLAATALAAPRLPPPVFLLVLLLLVAWLALAGRALHTRR